MKELSPLEKLDCVLEILNNNSKTKLIQKDILDIVVLGNFNISDDELTLILDKLCVDNYVYISTIMEGNPCVTTVFYYISFNGQLFFQEGGYFGKFKRDVSHARNTIILNWTIAIAGGIAAAYYLLEILRNYIAPFFRGCSTF